MLPTLEVAIDLVLSPDHQQDEASNFKGLALAKFNINASLWSDNVTRPYSSPVTPPPQLLLLLLTSLSCTDFSWLDRVECIMDTSRPRSMWHGPHPTTGPASDRGDWMSQGKGKGEVERRKNMCGSHGGGKGKDRDGCVNYNWWCRKSWLEDTALLLNLLIFCR